MYRMAELFHKNRWIHRQRGREKGNLFFYHKAWSPYIQWAQVGYMDWNSEISSWRKTLKTFLEFVPSCFSLTVILSFPINSAYILISFYFPKLPSQSWTRDCQDKSHLYISQAEAGFHGDSPPVARVRRQGKHSDCWALFFQSVLRRKAGQEHQRMNFAQEFTSYYQAVPSNNHFCPLRVIHSPHNMGWSFRPNNREEWSLRLKKRKKTNFWREKLKWREVLGRKV